MNVEVHFGEQSCQDERLEVFADDLGIAINRRFALNRFSFCTEDIQERLRAFLGRNEFRDSRCEARPYGLGRVGPNELRPVFLKQLRASKYVGPNEFTIQSNDYANRVPGIEALRTTSRKSVRWDQRSD